MNARTLFFASVISLLTIACATGSWEHRDTYTDAYRLSPESRPVLRYEGDSTYLIKDWYGVQGSDLCFKANTTDSTITITNAYANKNDQYFFVRISKNDHRGEPAYAALYPGKGYSEFVATKEKGSLYVFAFIYDGTKRLLTRGYYEVLWGGSPRQTIEADRQIMEEMNEERIEAMHEADSIQKAQLVDSILMIRQAR